MIIVANERYKNCLSDKLQFSAKNLRNSPPQRPPNDHKNPYFDSKRAKNPYFDSPSQSYQKSEFVKKYAIITFFIQIL